MKKIKTLKSIKTLINNETVQFIPVEDKNMIYIDLGCSVLNLAEAYQVSRNIAKTFDTEVIFNFNGCDILVNEDTKMKNVAKQYGRLDKIQYKSYVEKEFAKAVKNLNVNNAKRKTREVLRLIKDENGFKKYISAYQLNTLSHALITAYKNTQPDMYLDNMVEEAKVLKKTK